MPARRTAVDSPILMLEGQPEGHGIAEGDGEGIVSVSRDENSLASFAHCSAPGDGHGFIELAVHAGTVCGRDRDGWVKGGSHRSNLSHSSVVGGVAGCYLARRTIRNRVADSEAGSNGLSVLAGSDFRLRNGRTVVGRRPRG